MLDRTGVRFGAPLRAPVTHRTWHRHSSLGWAVGTDRAKKPQNRCSRDDQAKMQFDVDSCHIRKPKGFGFRFEASARFEATQILNIAPSLLGGWTDDDEFSLKKHSEELDMNISTLSGYAPHPCQSVRTQSRLAGHRTAQQQQS